MKKLRISCLIGVLTLLSRTVPAPAAGPAETPDGRDILRRVIEKAVRSGECLPPKLAAVAGRFTFTVHLDEKTYAFLAPPLANIAGREITPEITGAGSFKLRFDPAKKDFTIARLFLEATSSLGALAYLKDGDDLTVLAPQLGIMVKEQYSRITELAGRKSARSPFQERLIGLYWTFLSGDLKSGIDLNSPDVKVSTIARDGTDYYQVSVPGPRRETILVDVRTDSYTPSRIKITTEKDNLSVTLVFPRNRDGQASSLASLPEEFIISGSGPEGSLSVDIKPIQYNPAVTDDDFKIRTVNLPEMLGIAYRKAFPPK